uniref:Disease resistance protein RGA4 n=1 Tax=Cajanus cajan TaxID=3821 RepID=A0A151TGN4_CAJCA|nr:Putative disease resistance protein RGA4 [Cajanus cajan]
MTVPQLSKKINYDNWCLQMKTLLGSQSLWDIVEKGFQEPEEDEDQSVAQIAALEKTRVKDKSALYFLYNAVDESGFEKIANAASSKEAWKILEVAHRGNHRVRQIRLQTLRGEFECLKMEDKEQVSEYITRVEKVANQLGRNGESMPASRIVEKILRSLTDDFESIACVIEESKDLSVLSVEELAGSLEAHEQRRRKMKNTLDQALQAQLNLNETRNTQGRTLGGKGRGDHGGRGKGRGDHGGGGKGRGDHGGDQGRGRGRGDHGGGQGRGDRSQGSQPRSEVECYKCGKLGHYAKECRSANCYNLVELLSSDEKSEAELDSSCLNNSVWYLDTGASNHMYEKLKSHMKEKGLFIGSHRDSQNHSRGSKLDSVQLHQFKSLRTYILPPQRVKSVMDCEKANMSRKQLNKLVLSWDKNEESELEKYFEIVQVLQPDTRQLESLSLVGYNGDHFPPWISSPSLQYLELEDCIRCSQIPTLGKLASLKTLRICNMIEVKHLNEESYDGGLIFMGLENLSLEKLPKLVRVSREDGENMFPRLSKFEIFECPELLGLPSFPSIKDLRIQGNCKLDLLSSIHKLSSLEYLWFEDNEELKCFPNGMFQNLNSLKELYFHRLFKLEVFPTKLLLHSLKKLQIVGSSKFNDSIGLHEALQHLTALEELKLEHLPNLQSLPDCFGNLRLLRLLTLHNCSKLACLPSSLRFSCLDRLDVQGCPELDKRCREDTGEDWGKIVHIPNIRVIPKRP